MESNFFSGSENLYKYLVSIGILMLVLTIYYPLREKQQLEILKINLESEFNALNFEIKQNRENVKELTSWMKNKDLDVSQKRKLYFEIAQKQKANTIKQIGADGKLAEIKSREKYIRIYGKLFWIFISAGSLLVIFGFYKWYKSKKVDDEKSKLEMEILKVKLAHDQRLLQNTTSSGNSINPTIP